MSVAAKNALVDFLNYAKERLPKTKFSKLKKKVQESNPIPAYTNETYLALAKMLASIGVCDGMFDLDKYVHTLTQRITEASSINEVIRNDRMQNTAVNTLMEGIDF